MRMTSRKTYLLRWRLEPFQNPFRIIRPAWEIKNLKRCENVSTDWNCSSGINQHSVCIRQCQQDFHSESIKCKCKHHICRWEKKGKPCTLTGGLDQGTTRWNQKVVSQTGQFQQNKQPEIINFSQIGSRIPESISVGSRNFQFGENSDENPFVQMFRDLKLSNTGPMVFNVNYNFNNYPSSL